MPAAYCHLARLVPRNGIIQVLANVIQNIFLPLTRTGRLYEIRIAPRKSIDNRFVRIVRQTAEVGSYQAVFFAGRHSIGFTICNLCRAWRTLSAIETLTSTRIRSWYMPRYLPSNSIARSLSPSLK